MQLVHLRSSAKESKQHSVSDFFQRAHESLLHGPLITEIKQTISTNNTKLVQIIRFYYRSHFAIIDTADIEGLNI